MRPTVPASASRLQAPLKLGLPAGLAGSVRNRPFCWHVGVDGDPAQQVERCIKCLVVLPSGRNVGLRTGLLRAVSGEMSAHGRFALDLETALQLVRYILKDFDIGRDALCLDRLPGRRVIARRRQRQRAVAGPEWNDRLHRAFAERARPDQGRTFVVVKCARHDLGSRGRSTVDQDDERLAPGEVAAPGNETLGFLRRAPRVETTSPRAINALDTDTA